MKNGKILLSFIVIFSIMSTAMLIMSIIGLNTDNSIIMLVGLIAFFCVPLA